MGLGWRGGGCVAWVMSVCACGPLPGTEGDGSDGSDAGSAGVEAGDDGPTVDCSAIPPGAAEARLVVEGDTAAIEVLLQFAGGPEPLGCGDPLPFCDHAFHRLVPQALATGTFTTAAGALSHHVETCTCCNGEGGGPDESRDSDEISNGELVIDAVAAGCVVGSFLTGGEQLAFVAARC